MIFTFVSLQLVIRPVNCSWLATDSRAGESAHPSAPCESVLERLMCQHGCCRVFLCTVRSWNPEVTFASWHRLLWQAWMCVTPIQSLKSLQMHLKASWPQPLLLYVTCLVSGWVFSPVLLAGGQFLKQQQFFLSLQVCVELVVEKPCVNAQEYFGDCWHIKLVVSYCFSFCFQKYIPHSGSFSRTSGVLGCLAYVARWGQCTSAVTPW